MRLGLLLLAALATSMILASLAPVHASSGSVWYMRIAGDGDDEWSKSILEVYSEGHLYAYVVGNKWRQPIVAKFDLTTGSVSWVTAVGNRSAGDLGDWPEFRDVAVCGGKVFVSGYTFKGSPKVLVAAIDASSGKVLWIRSYGSTSGEVKGLGVAVDPSCRYLYVVGYEKNAFGTKGRDAVVLKIDASSGELVKAVVLDFGGSDYLVDDALVNGTLYAVGMTDAFDTPGKYYDIVVTALNPDTLAIEKAVVLGNKGVYEVAAISNYKNSGGAIATDGHAIYVLGQMKSVKKGKTSTLVIALDPKTLRVTWSVRVYNASDIDVEFYPDQVAVGGRLLYVAGHSWFYPGLWKEGGFVAVLDKDSGSPVAFYVVRDSELKSGMGIHGVSVVTVGGIDYVAAVSDYYLPMLRVSIENKVGQVSVVKYPLKEIDATSKASEKVVTSSVSVEKVSTEVSHPSFGKPSNGKSNYLLLLFAEPAKALGVKVVTKTVTSTVSITLTRTVVVTYTTTKLSTLTTTVSRVSTITKTTTVPTTVTKVTVSATTVPTTVTSVLTSTVVKSSVPGWVWGVAIALFLVGLGIGVVVGMKRK